MSKRARTAAALLAVLALALAACNGDGPIDPSPDHDGDGTESPSPAQDVPVRGEITIDIEPLRLDELPDPPPQGIGQALVGDDAYGFAVTFCDDEQPIGTGEGEGVHVAWDLREDGDHRVAVRLDDGDVRWVRAGPAQAEFDRESGTLRFAGAFLPFRSTDGSQAVQAGVIAVCPDAGA